MSGTPIALIDEPAHVRAALSPIRRHLLQRLREPSSATQLAGELDIGRQRVNYHLRALEHAGLIELASERQRRGCVERIMVARANAFVVDPSVMTDAPVGAPAPAHARAAVQDRFAAEHLIETAANVVRDVARMQTAAQRQGTRLLTFTFDTEVSFAQPDDLQRFTTALAEAVARTAAKFHAPGRVSRRYRIVVGGHPAPGQAQQKRRTRA